MAKFILDTGLLLGYVRDARFVQYVDAKYRVTGPPNIVVISTVSVGEIKSLAMQFGWGAKKAETLDALLRRVPHVGIGHPMILDRYAEIDVYSLGKHPKHRLPQGMSSRNMGKNDLWIAATGSVVKATLLTLDTDFDHLDGVFLPVARVDPSWTAADASSS